MASLVCPHCGATVPAERSWAQAAVSSLVPAPAVPDMATQVRCPSCARVFAAGDSRHETADRFFTPARVIVVLGALALAWALLELLAR